MVVLHRQQIALARLEPASRGGALALRAMAVAARVVGNLVAPTTLTAQHMSHTVNPYSLAERPERLQIDELRRQQFDAQRERQRQEDYERSPACLLVELEHMVEGRSSEGHGCYR